MDEQNDIPKMILAQPLRDNAQGWSGIQLIGRDNNFDLVPNCYLGVPLDDDDIVGIALWDANTFLMRCDNNHATFAGLPEEAMDTMNVDGCPRDEYGRCMGINNIAHFKINQAIPGLIDFEVTEIGFDDSQPAYSQRIVYSGSYTIWWKWQETDDQP